MENDRLKKEENPFTLTFGKQPNLQIIRHEDMSRITEDFRAEHPVSQLYLIEGIRGSGKTVLMTAVARSLSDEGDWIVVNLNQTVDLIADFAARLEESCHRIPRLLEKGFQLSAAGIGIGIGGAVANANHVSTITSLLQRIQKKNRRVLITIDEVQHTQNMRVFASQFQIFLREEYPVFLIMTGLYEKIHAIQNDPSLTFLLRSPKVRMEPLSIFQIKKQYEKVFQAGEGITSQLASLTKGYAFAFQALGDAYWRNRDKKDMDVVLQRFDEMLDDYVYQKIWEDCSAKDREIILAMDEGETKVGELCGRVSMTQSNFSRYRDKMIRRGILRAAGHGYVILALPRLPLIARHYQ